MGFRTSILTAAIILAGFAPKGTASSFANIQDNIKIHYGDDPDFVDAYNVGSAGSKITRDVQLSPAGGHASVSLLAEAHGFDLSALALNIGREGVGVDNSGRVWLHADYHAFAMAGITDTITIAATSNGRVQYHFDLEGFLAVVAYDQGGALDLQDAYAEATLTLVQGSI